MTTQLLTRRLAVASAFGGGTVALLSLGLAGVLLAEAKLAGVRLDALKGDPPRAAGLYGTEFTEARDPDAVAVTPLTLAVFGDSTAAGFGVDRGRDTPGALLAAGIAAVAERPVQLVVAAANGAASDDLESQLDLVLTPRSAVPDIALVMVGVNDIARRIRTDESARLLGDAVRRLRATGAEVVVGTCPDLGVVEPMGRPLRQLAQRVGRRLAAAQAHAVEQAGGHSVPLADLLGPEFAHRPEMFASDRYHPSARGYLTASIALLPTMCEALGIWPHPEDDRAGREPACSESISSLPVNSHIPHPEPVSSPCS